MAEEQKTPNDSQEPSMEDILASIRRILSEEAEEGADASEVAVAQRPRAVVEPTDEPDEAADADVPPARAAAVPAWRKQAELEEDEEVADFTDDEHEATESGSDVDSDIGFDDSDAVPELGPERAQERESSDVLDLTPEMRSGPVISSPTAVASTDVLSQLAKAILNQRDVSVGGSDVTIEGMVREMLRPLLKQWLDRNLPYLVERLVKREIDLMVNRAERLED